MNTVILSGNLVRDPELRYTQSGSPIANLTVANNRKWKDQSGELKEEVSFIGVVAFGKQAEVISQHFKKGSKILVQGRLKQEQWEDKQTQKKQSKTVVTLESFEFFSSGQITNRETPPAGGPKREPLPPGTPEDDDVPF